MITLDRGPFGTYLIRNDDGHDILVQTDTDYPGVASSFGWGPALVEAPSGQPCWHSFTDGTIDCPHCGTPASAFIASARAFLDANIGARVNDPGYFDTDPGDDTTGIEDRLTLGDLFGDDPE